MKQLRVSSTFEIFEISKLCNPVASIFFIAMGGEDYLKVNGQSVWFMEELSHCCPSYEGDEVTDLFHIDRPLTRKLISVKTNGRSHKLKREEEKKADEN